MSAEQHHNTESAHDVAFLGLGTMGYPMAGHLARAGHRVTVYNRTTAKAERWVGEYTGQLAPTPAEAVAGAEMVFICVGNDDDLRQVVQAALPAMKPGTIIADHSTVSAAVSREIYALCKASGVQFLDSPVSGGQAGAEKGILTIMVGGDEDAFARAEPVMASYGQRVTLMGPSGNGQLTKMVNQICIGGLLQGLAEALAFAERAGLDGNRVLDVISKGASQSWQMENRGRTMLANQFDFGFAIDLMRKDFGIVFDEARRNGSSLPVTALVDQFYSELQAKGANRLDTSCLIKRLRD